MRYEIHVFNSKSEKVHNWTIKTNRLGFARKFFNFIIKEHSNNIRERLTIANVGHPKIELYDNYKKEVKRRYWF
jgi:hypothetical protein